VDLETDTMVKLMVEGFLKLRAKLDSGSSASRVGEAVEWIEEVVKQRQARPPNETKLIAPSKASEMREGEKGL
jgi:hypothetical protein